MTGLRMRSLLGLLVVSGLSTAAAQAPARDSQPTYFDFQVEKPVRPDSTNRPPIYPRELRAQNIQGDVMIMVVIDTLGRADMSTFQVVKTYHELFTESVKTALAEYHFSPAMLGGRKVRQIVHMPFRFRLGGLDIGQRRTPPM